MAARTVAIVIGGLLAAGWQAPPASPRPRVFGIAHVSVQSSDLAKARAFYGGVLGYGEQPPARTNRAVFVVNARQRLIVEDGLPADRDDRLLNVGFDVEGRSGEARDPDGHMVQFVSMAGSADATDIPDRRISRRILHAGLTIKDPAAADRFYKDVLGFSEIWRGGRPEGTINWINMRVPDGTDYLEYMLVTSPPDRRQRGVLHHVALLVPDIQAAWEAAGGRTPAAKRSTLGPPNVGRNGRWQLNLYDTDGTRTELMEPFRVR
jgi:catechol 2,3-dioxygenase-like lactoylglutathione lyase family enzyme